MVKYSNQILNVNEQKHSAFSAGAIEYADYTFAEGWKFS